MLIRMIKVSKSIMLCSLGNRHELLISFTIHSMNSIDQHISFTIEHKTLRDTKRNSRKHDLQIRGTQFREVIKISISISDKSVPAS